MAKSADIIIVTFVISKTNTIMSKKNNNSLWLPWSNRFNFIILTAKYKCI